MINKCTACCSVWPTFKKNWGDNPPYLCRPAIHAVNHSFTMNSPFSFKHLVFCVCHCKKKDKERKKSTYRIYAHGNVVMNMVLKWVHFIGHVILRAEIHCSIIKKVIMYKQDWEIISLTGSFYFARCQTMKMQILKATLRLHKVKRNLFVRMYIWVLQVICLFREMKKWHSA